MFIETENKILANVKEIKIIGIKNNNNIPFIFLNMKNDPQNKTIIVNTFTKDNCILDYHFIYDQIYIKRYKINGNDIPCITVTVAKVYKIDPEVCANKEYEIICNYFKDYNSYDRNDQAVLFNKALFEKAKKVLYMKI